MTDEAIALLAPGIGTRAACVAAGVAQAAWYRRHRISPPPPKAAPVPHAERVQPRALAPAERQAILDVLHSGRFADTAPDEVWATLPDEGACLGSVSTYYRVLREAGESRERRAQATHPATVKPELAADGPDQVWSWDITKLHGPAKWAYYHLYVILDIFSRHVAGWMAATRESAALAEKLIAATCAKQGITRAIPDHVPSHEGERRHLMLIQNMLRRPAEFTSAPPAVGPAAPDSLGHAAHTPTARARRWSGNVFLVIDDTATGFGIDPPRPAVRGTR